MFVRGLTQYSSQLVKAIKLGYGLLASTLLLAIAWNQGEAEPALDVRFMALGLLVLLSTFATLGLKERTSIAIGNAMFLSLLSLTLIWLSGDNAISLMWLYFFPIAAFFLLTPRYAIGLNSLYSLAILTLAWPQLPPFVFAQFMAGYFCIVLLGYFLASIKFQTNQMLEPLISRDPHTGAHLERLLARYLTTEILRAEREGTGLLLMRIQLDRSKRLSFSESEKVECAKAIAHHLRPFDQHFNIEPNGFAVVLPHMTTLEAKELALEMIDAMPPATQKDIQIGLASLNVGDTAESLIDLSAQGIGYVQH